MVSPQLKALWHHAQLHRAPPDDTGGRLTASTAERLPAEFRNLPHGSIDLGDGTILVPDLTAPDGDADRRPLRLSRAEKDLLRRMPRPADPAVRPSDPLPIDFGQLVAIDPNGDLEDEGGCA